MGISALLSLPMAKEKEKAKLRPVDEEAEARKRYVRLGKDVAEELEDLPPVRVGPAYFEARLNPVARDEMKIRQSDPDVSSLIEREIPVTDEPWEGPPAEATGFPWGWVAVVASVFGGAIIWSLLSVTGAEEQRKDLTKETLTLMEREEREEMEAAALIGTLERVAREFLDSRSVEEMSGYVRHSGRVAPLMERYYAERGLSPLRVVNVLSLDPLTIERRANFWMVSCELRGGKTTQMLLEAVSETEAKVDWETFVCYQPMDWDVFTKKRPGGYTGDFRVYAEVDHFHSHEFVDSEKYDCYRLTVLGGLEALYGYVSKSSSHAPQIAELVAASGGRPVPMILSLHLPEGLDSPRGVIVERLVNPRWLYVENPGSRER
jgi:hypothetical protein